MPQHLLTLRDYQRTGAEIGFRCRCGVRRVALPADLLATWPHHAEPAEIARRMRCRACGQKTVSAYAVLPDRILQPRQAFQAVWFRGLYDRER